MALASPGATEDTAASADLGPVLMGEVDFVLPHGYRDASGTIHRDGRMRLATARDELAPLVDPRVARNRAYLVVLLLSRVITRLGTIEAVTPEVVEGLYATDFAYLQGLYRRLNIDPLAAPASCPHCGKSLAQGVDGLGGAVATPPG